MSYRELLLDLGLVKGLGNGQSSIQVRTGPSPNKAVKFDWSDEKTFENPFIADPDIDRIYLILLLLPVIGQLATVKNFIGLVISTGVKRFVFLTASVVEIGGQVFELMWKVHEYLVNIKVEYTVLRPTWFIRTYLTPCESAT